MQHVDYIFDTLYIQQLYNLTLPDWTEKVYPEPMNYLRDLVRNSQRLFAVGLYKMFFANSVHIMLASTLAMQLNFYIFGLVFFASCAHI